MIGLFLFVISFIVFAATGTLGGDLIYALDVVETLYWIIFTIVAFLAFITLLSFTAIGSLIGASLQSNSIISFLSGALFGSSGGIFLATLMIAKIGVQLWLTIWLMDNIDPAITTFTMLESKETLALAVLFLLAIIRPKSNN